MAAYRTASRLFPGSHVPWLGIGIECLRTNHLHLALQYIQQVHDDSWPSRSCDPRLVIKQAQELSPQEPLVLHELGVLHFHNGDYEEAAHYFLQVAENAQSYDLTTREPSIFNLGHTFRKLRQFDKALNWCHDSQTQNIDQRGLRNRVSATSSANALYRYRAALAISPRVASTYSALGFTEHLSGNLHEAIELYHQSLSL